MRLTPTNNIPLERLVPAEGLSANGFHLPAGTNVGMSAYTVHRNKEIYGANADVFRPERWLNTDPASVQRMNKYFFAVSDTFFDSVPAETGWDVRRSLARVSAAAADVFSPWWWWASSLHRSSWDSILNGPEMVRCGIWKIGGCRSNTICMFASHRFQGLIRSRHVSLTQFLIILILR